jgi:hypothetical protein
LILLHAVTRFCKNIGRAIARSASFAVNTYRLFKESGAEAKTRVGIGTQAVQTEREHSRIPPIPPIPAAERQSFAVVSEQKAIRIVAVRVIWKKPKSL